MNRSDGDMPIIDSSESSTSLLSSRRNKDILGMLGDDVENQTDMMCEEWFNLEFNNEVKVTFCGTYKF